MPAPTHTPIDLATDALAVLQPIPDTTSSDRYPDLYAPGVQATVEERLAQIIFELNRASRFIRSIKPAEIETLIGGVNDEINGFRVFRGAEQPATQTARFGDIWLSPGDGGVRVPRVFNGVGFVEDLYAVDAILMPIIARLQALESEQAEVFQDAVDELKDELTGTATAAGDTLGKLEALIAAASAAASSAASAAAAASVPLSQKGAANGVATLDSSGKVPSGQLPSFVDDIIEVANFAALPGTGETGKIYVTLSDDKQFRWSGSAYVEIVGSPGSTDALPEGTTNKYFTDARAQSALAALLDAKLSIVPISKAALKALTPVAGMTLRINAPGTPTYRWTTGNFTARGASDPGETVYIAATGTALSAGAWVLQGDWAVNGLDARLAGYAADYVSSSSLGTDNTSILAAALAIIGVREVVLPEGPGRITSLTIPRGKKLRGQGFAYDTFVMANPVTDIEGTVLVSRLTAAMGGDGFPTNKVIELKQESEIEDVLIYWADQPASTTGWTPTNTPWAIKAGTFTATGVDRASRGRIIDVDYFGFTHGVDLERGLEDGLISGLGGQAYKCDLRMDGIHHTVTTSRLNFWVAKDVTTEIQNYMLANRVSTIVGRIDDWVCPDEIFIYGARTAIRFEGSRSPDFTGQPAYLFTIGKLYADNCTTALRNSNTNGPLTGSIRELIVQRPIASGGLTPQTGGDTEGLSLTGNQQIRIDDLKILAPGGRGNGTLINTSGNGWLSIGHAACDHHDLLNTNAPAFQAGADTMHLIFDTPVFWRTDGGWLATATAPIFSGAGAGGERNIQTASARMLDLLNLGAPAEASRNFNMGGGAQFLTRNNGFRPGVAGVRQFRWLVWADAHASATAVIITCSGISALNKTLTSVTGGGLFGSGWENISGISRYGAAEIGDIFVAGNNGGVANLTITGFRLEFR